MTVKSKKAKQGGYWCSVPTGQNFGNYFGKKWKEFSTLHPQNKEKKCKNNFQNLKNEICIKKKFK